MNSLPGFEDVGAGSREDEVVFVPVAAVPAAGDVDVSLELRTLVDGRLALPVYSSAADLTRCCGDRQPGAAIPADRVDELLEQSGAAVVVQDLPLPDDQRRTAS
ncbi:SAV_915 family protein [Actinomycetospora sp. OC33-EN08]|uniref:SAV_915 family protein n=1 Tax=Actinomycetospora aurantiaca TaxID=3129233 RepID=A0ABU8MI86_9PSEU